MSVRARLELAVVVGALVRLLSFDLMTKLPP